MKQKDISVIRLLQNFIDNFLLRRLFSVNHLPVVRIDLLANDQITHILRERQLRDLLGVFRLVVDSKRWAKQNGFDAENALDQALR